MSTIVEYTSKMKGVCRLVLVASTALTAFAAPTVVGKRATTCTFTDASAVSASKTACSTIVLGSIAVPAGETLDLTELEDGTSASQVHLLAN